MKKVLVIVSLLMLCPLTAFAEGGCPPGSYPIGGQGVRGCAPIPTNAAPSEGPVPTGKWETRWGAISEDSNNMITGASVSRKSKREAIAAAEAECKRTGGIRCKTRITYHNQCVAIADPDAQQLAKGGGRSMVVSAETVDKAKALASQKCTEIGGGQTCSIVYSACSPSEFKRF